MARPEGRSVELEGPRVVGFLGMFLSPPVREPGSAVSCLSGVWSKALATWGFRTFYRLTEPYLV